MEEKYMPSQCNNHLINEHSEKCHRFDIEHLGTVIFHNLGYQTTDPATMLLPYQPNSKRRDQLIGLHSLSTQTV
mgnify:CR=1 FL=1